MSSSPMVDRQAEVVRMMPEAYVRAKLSEREFLDSWFDALRSRVQAGKRDAIRLVAEILKLVGPQVAIILAERFGVRDEAELGSLVGRGRKLAELESMPESEQQKLCESYLEDVYRRDAVAWRAFREKVDGMSRAEEVAS